MIFQRGHPRNFTRITIQNLIGITLDDEENVIENLIARKPGLVILDVFHFQRNSEFIILTP